MSNTTRQKDTGAPLKPGMTPGSYSAFESDEPTVSTLGFEDEKVFHSLTRGDMQRYLDLATRQARRRLTRVGRNDPQLVEDTAQAAVAQFLDAIDKRPPLAYENTEAYLNQIVTNTVSAETSTVSKAARSGFVVLTAEAEKMEAEIGRRLTQQEYEALGKRIWDQWPADRPKPPKNFYMPDAARNMALMPIGGADDEHIRMDDAFGTSSHTYDPAALEETMGQWSKILLNEAATTNAASERLFRYNALAEQLNIPQVIPGSITRRTEINVREEINEVICAHAGIDNIKQATEEDMAEAVHEVFRAVADGNVHPAEEALFTPWNRPLGPSGPNGSIPSEALDTDGRIAIAEELVKYPKKSYALWKSALLMADSTNYERVLKAIDRRNREVGAA